jgi:hypothetical protein
VDFKFENVIVSLHSLKTMGLGSIILRNGELLGHSPIRKIGELALNKNHLYLLQISPKWRIWYFDNVPADNVRRMHHKDALNPYGMWKENKQLLCDTRVTCSRQELCLSLYWYTITTAKPNNTNVMSYMYRFMHFEHECVWAT